MRSHERVDKFGEVFTPRRLVVNMLRLIEKNWWSDPTNTILDPCCGDGAFLCCAVYLKVKAGLTPLQALQTTFGVDIMQDNVDDCRERLLKYTEKASGEVHTDEWIATVTKNVVCHDALTYNFEFKQRI